MLIFGKKVLAAMSIFVLGAFTSSFMGPMVELEVQAMATEEEGEDKNDPPKTPIVTRNDNNSNSGDNQKDDNDQDPKECLKNINKRQKDIAKELKKIKEMLKDKKIAKQMRLRR